MKILKRVGISVAALALIIVAVAFFGSWLSLDRDYNHTNEASSLPMLSDETSTGIVQVPANGFNFRARVAGLDQDGPVVILLHGFPVTSAMWSPLMEPLADAGYRAIAFDQRGYSPGARPEDLSAYGIDNLVSDVLAIADAMGSEQFHLIGHDWGAGVGWSTVLQHPDRILSWSGLSIAHPAAFADALENDPDQQARSGYFTLFSMPLVPETLFTFSNLAVLEGLYGSMPQESKQEYLNAFSEPGALTAALNWYREAGSTLTNPTEVNNEVDIPTLFIWGNQDTSAGRVAVEGQEKYMRGPYRFLELDADHWLVSSHPDEVVEAVVSHLNAH